VREAGTDELSFESFDEVNQRTKDLLSLSDHLYCPEGHVPGTRIGVRVITNSATLAPNLVGYLERAPKRDPPPAQTITAYVLEGTEEFFSGYAIEEIEDKDGEAKSVAAVVVVSTNPTIESIAAGIELSVEGLLADEEERKKAEEEAAE